MARGKRTIRASEIGSFLYCQRAWWYQRNKAPTINTRELAAGQQFHEEHVSQAKSASFLRKFSWALILAAIILLSIFISTIV